MLNRDFYIAPIIKNGKPGLIIRKSFNNKNEIKEIIETILRDKKMELKVTICFKDPFTAKLRLKQLGLLD